MASSFTVSDTLGAGDLRVIRNILSAVKNEWRMIGVQLGISKDTLDELKQEDDPLSEVINYWLKGNIKDSLISWASIVKSLKSKHVDKWGLAEKIGSQYCKGCKHNSSTKNNQEKTLSSLQAKSTTIPNVDKRVALLHQIQPAADSVETDSAHSENNTTVQRINDISSCEDTFGDEENSRNEFDAEIHHIREKLLKKERELVEIKHEKEILEKAKELVEKEKDSEISILEKEKELMEKEMEHDKKLLEKEHEKELMEKEKEHDKDLMEKEHEKELLEKEHEQKLTERDHERELMEKEHEKELMEKECEKQLMEKEYVKQLLEKEKIMSLEQQLTTKECELKLLAKKKKQK